MSHNIKFKLLFILLVGWCIESISLQEVHAADGSLSINNQVISDSAKEKVANTTSQEIPDLFLPDKTNEVKKKQSEEKEKIDQAKAVVFSGKKAQKEKDNRIKNANAQLFTSQWTDSFTTIMANRPREDHSSMTMPNWLLVVLMGIVCIVAIGAGGLLGKKYARWFRGGNDEKNHQYQSAYRKP